MTNGHDTGAAQAAPLSKYRVPECDLVLRYQHPGCDDPLIVPIHLVCNTPEHILIANIKANSVLDREWIKQEPAHSGVAVICGSGPSLADGLVDIEKLRMRGATVFAMNGAAGFMQRSGILAHYQVIADAREQTAELVGPACAHLFASQAHPKCFELAPLAKLFQVNFHEDHREFLKIIEGIGPEHFALIGSHGSVGNVSLTLAFAMGFRDIHVFGFDSSFSGEDGHAFEQPMNVSEPICDQTYNGKQYRMTFTMKSQADVFPRLTYQLQDMGARFTVHGTGYLQDRWNGERRKTLEQRETDKYHLMWEQDAYRVKSFGLDEVGKAAVALSMKPGDGLIDFGCGSGRATKQFCDMGIIAVGVDLATNALETEVQFINANLWKTGLPDELRGFNAEWAFCCDVMEHIPREKVEDVLRNIANSVTKGAYFSIDFYYDEMGQLIGQPLHLTVKHPAWWIKQLQQHFAIVHERDGGIFVCFHAKA